MKFEEKINWRSADDVFNGRFNPIIAAYLQDKGIKNDEMFDEFFNVKFSFLRKNADYLDAEKFVNILCDAIKNNKKITIYGDYDVDGIMGTFIIYSSLKYLSCDQDINWFVNERFSEGYGLNIKGVKRLMEEYPDTELIVTVDNGIAASEGIKYATEHGIRVIVSDHHIQKSDMPLPDCDAVVDEKRIDEDPDKLEEICGAELARRLMTHLFYCMKGPENYKDEDHNFLYGLLLYSGMATIADSVPMNRANHYISRYALKTLQSMPEWQKNIWSILREKLNIQQFDHTTYGFRYGPLFNAAGRITGRVDIPMQLLTAAREQKWTACDELLEKMIALNKERQQLTEEMDKKAVCMVEENGFDRDKFLVVAGDDFHEGINGLTASHLVEKYNVPTIVLSPLHDDPDTFKGSGRSIEGFNLFKALTECQDLLVGFGGHEMAAGVSVKRENIAALRERLREIGRREVPDVNKDVVKVDFALSMDDVSISMINGFASLMPYGPGFEEPVFGFEGTIKGTYTMGEGGKHIKFFMENNNPEGQVEVIWWNGTEEFKTLGISNGQSIMFTGTPGVNEYNGRRSIQIKMRKMYAEN